jgi:hypothetical protein
VGARNVVESVGRKKVRGRLGEAATVALIRPGPFFALDKVMCRKFTSCHGRSGNLR